MTFVSTNEAILYQRARPVFADVEPLTLNMDLGKAERLVSPRTRAIVAVHYGGNPLRMEELYAFAQRHRLAVVEDAAHACGASYQGRRIGSFGLTCFSFHAVKNLPTGDGGMVTTDDDATADQLRRLRWMGISKSTFSRSASGGYSWEYDVTEAGYKYHMNDIAAAIGLAHLKHVDEWNARRREIAARYREGLREPGPELVQFVEDTPGAVTAQHLCVVRVPDRDAVVDELKANGISAGVHYKPNHLYPLFAGARRGDVSAAEGAYREILSLPLHLLLSEADVERVIDTLRRILLTRGRRLPRRSAKPQPQ
jgi:perosamine synthetase